MLFMRPESGWIEVICGSMYSGKTEELIRRIRLATIARKKVLQYRERHKTVDEFRSSRVIPEAVTTASQRLDRRFRVMALLQHLDEQQRTAFLLRCEGLALEVIAETMKLSLATVKRKLKQARAQIEQVASEDTHAFGDEALTVDDVIDSYRRD